MANIRDADIYVLIFILIVCNFSCRVSDKLRITGRAEWGSQPVIEDSLEHAIRYITIHHGGVEVSPDEDPHLYLQNLQLWSRNEKNWSDIPYHFLIDLQGRVYEGRPVCFPGDTNTDYDPSGHLLISIIGNYEVQEFTTDQYTVLVELLVHFCTIYQLDPAVIKAHRDYTQTACPGKNIYLYLENGRLISDVRHMLRGKKD